MCFMIVIIQIFYRTKRFSTLTIVFLSFIIISFIYFCYFEGAITSCYATNYLLLGAQTWEQGEGPHNLTKNIPSIANRCILCRKWIYNKMNKQVIGWVMKKERREIILIFLYFLFSFQYLVGIYMKMWFYMFRAGPDWTSRTLICWSIITWKYCTIQSL